MPPKTLLIVDDDNMLRQMLRQRLEAESFIVMEAAVTTRAVDILKQHTIDLVLLDLHLPDNRDGSIIRDVRQYTNVPVIMISGDDNTSQKVTSLLSGANDYVSKPFDFSELVARIQAHLRDHSIVQQIGAAQHNIKTASKIKFGQWVLDRSKFQVFTPDNTPCTLTPREFRLLEALIAQAHQAIQREDLCQALREEGYTPSTRAIDVKITRIRKKMMDDADSPKIIKTVRGIGYMFDEDITVIE